MVEQPPISMPLNECQKAFEEQFAEYILSRDGWGSYTHPDTRNAWSGFLAAWNTRVTRTPDSLPDGKDEYISLAEADRRGFVKHVLPDREQLDAAYSKGYTDATENFPRLMEDALRIARLPISPDRDGLIELIWPLLDPLQAPHIGNRSPSSEAAARRKAAEIVEIIPQHDSSRPVGDDKLIQEIADAIEPHISDMGAPFAAKACAKIAVEMIMGDAAHRKDAGARCPDRTSEKSSPASDCDECQGKGWIFDKQSNMMGGSGHMDCPKCSVRSEISVNDYAGGDGVADSGLAVGSIPPSPAPTIDIEAAIREMEGLQYTVVTGQEAAAINKTVRKCIAILRRYAGEKEGGMTDESGWNLLVRFEDQSPSYCYGFEAGRIWKQMEDGISPIEATVQEANSTTLRRMADAMKYTLSLEKTEVDSWLNATFTFIGSDPVRKRLTVIPGGLKP